MRAFVAYATAPGSLAAAGNSQCPKALFLHVVCSDAPEGTAADTVLAWLEAVQQEAPGAVMGVVFTHADLVADEGERDRRQQAVLARVQAEVERQVRAVNEAMRQAEGAFEANAAWREKQARRDEELEALDRGLAAWQETGAHSADSEAIGMWSSLVRYSALAADMDMRPPFSKPNKRGVEPRSDMYATKLPPSFNQGDRHQEFQPTQSKICLSRAPWQLCALARVTEEA